MTNPLKAVIDTSVFIAAIKSKSNSSAPVKIINDCHAGFFTIVISPQILEELTEKLIEFDFNEEVISNFIGTLTTTALMMSGSYTTDKLDSIDSKDNIILATAYESKSDFIVSLDKKHILPLKHFYGTEIIDPSSFIKEVESHKISPRQKVRTIIY